MIAFGAVFDDFIFGINSSSPKPYDIPFVGFSFSTSDKYFSDLITVRALKLSKPVVGSSQKIIGGFASN